MFLRTAWLMSRKDLAIEVQEPGDRLHDAVLRGVVRADLRVRVREGRAAGARSGGRHPVDCDRVLRARWRSAARSSASATSETLRALLLAPATAPALYVGKLLGIAAAARASPKLLIVPLVALLFQAPLFAHPLLLVGLLAPRHDRLRRGRHAVRRDAGAARSRDVLLPILLYPITIPVIIAGVRGTAALLQPTPDVSRWR